MKSKVDLSHIDTLEDLKREQLVIKARLRMQEEELKEHFKNVPKEALKAGASAIVPQVLQNKATSNIFNASRNIVGSLFAKKGHKSDVLWKGVRQAGMYVLLKQALKILMRRF